MNPVATGDGLSLNLSEEDNAQDMALAHDVAKHFRVKDARADEIVREVMSAVRGRRAVATSAGDLARRAGADGRRVSSRRRELTRQLNAVVSRAPSLRFPRSRPRVNRLDL